MADEPTEVVTTAELERLRAAEDACFSMVLAIDLGGMNRVPKGWRRVVAQGGLQRWQELVYDQGVLKARA